MIHFVAGMPRALSTALVSILSQNPRFSVTGTSPMLNILSAARKERTGADFKAMRKDEIDRRMSGVLKGIISGWFANDSGAIHFDKCRGWLGHIDLLNSLYESPKIIVPIRDIRGCVTSMEKLWRSNPGVWTDLAPSGSLDGATIQNRVESYLTTSPLGISIERLFEAKQRGQLESVLIVRAEDLGSNPLLTLKMVHAYLGEDDFNYDFSALSSPNDENDAVHEPFGEHTVHAELALPAEDWNEVLTTDVAAGIKERCAWFYEAFYPNAV